MLKLDKNIENALTEIKLYGYYKFQLFDKDDDIFKNLQVIHNLSSEANLPGKEEEYEGGFCKYFSYQNINESYFRGKNYFLKWLNNKFINSIIDRLGGKNKYILDHLYQTLDTPKSLHIAQDPHFDRIPTLKFMLYLNNMNADNGAFILSPGSHHWVKENFKKRGKFNNEAFFKKTRKIPQPIIDRLIHLNGKAGTVIVFLTDCIHMQGKVEKHESRIFRAGYRYKSNNNLIKYSKFIKNKFKEKFKIDYQIRI